MTDNIPVRKIDQDNICAFSLLVDEYKALKIKIKELEDEKGVLDDIEDEVVLTEHLREGQGMLNRWGDAYIELDDERFEEVTEQEKQAISEKLSQSKARLVEVQDKMATLRAELQSRFGDQVGLDFE